MCLDSSFSLQWDRLAPDILDRLGPRLAQAESARTEGSSGGDPGFGESLHRQLHPLYYVLLSCLKSVNNSGLLSISHGNPCASLEVGNLPAGPGPTPSRSTTEQQSKA